MPGVKLTVERTDADIRLTAELTGTDLGKAIQRLQEAAADARPALKDAGEYLINAIDRRFSAETDPEGNAWKPLSSRYKRRKKGPKILTERHRLRRSIIYRAESDSLEVGTNVVYAAIHQLGGEIKRKGRSQTLAFGKKGFMSRSRAGKTKAKSVRIAIARIGEGITKMPARPYLGLSHEDEEELQRILGEHLEEALSGR